MGQIREAATGSSRPPVPLFKGTPHHHHPPPPAALGSSWRPGPGSSGPAPRAGWHPFPEREDRKVSRSSRLYSHSRSVGKRLVADKVGTSRLAALTSCRLLCKHMR